MAKSSGQTDVLTQLSKIALALPETTRVLKGSHAQFLVREKTFAYFLNYHHGDGIVSIACKVLAGDNKTLAEAQPRRFYLPAYMASRGWVALRLGCGKDGLGRGQGASDGQLCAGRSQETCGTGDSRLMIGLRASHLLPGVST
jgi:phosphoribosylglycinamide formyltransferase-1